MKNEQIHNITLIVTDPQTILIELLHNSLSLHLEYPKDLKSYTTYMCIPVNSYCSPDAQGIGSPYKSNNVRVDKNVLHKTHAGIIVSHKKKQCL